MRIIFHDPNNPVEASERQRLMGQVNAWWRAFSEKQAAIKALFRQQAEWDLGQWMLETLQSISPDLMWEYGPAVECDGHRLVITPETHKHLQPLVGLILRHAPSLPAWEFYTHRLPESLDAAQMTVQGRTGGNLDDVKVVARMSHDGRINLTFHSPNCTSVGDQQSTNDAFVATETLLGEDILDQWVGLIEAVPMMQPKRFLGLFKSGGGNLPNMIPLDRLKPTVDSLILSSIDQLPPEPLHAAGDAMKWTLFKLKPKEAKDYPGQRDMFVGRTCVPKMWQDAHTGRSVYSRRYSRCGETFCYVKLDGSQGLASEKFADKSEIEDALDAALMPSGLGRVIGGGTGLRYSYVDLSLADLGQAIAVVRNVLSQGAVPKRSWILFYDSVLAKEWVGIYDDSPEPPMEPGEDE